MRSEKLIFHIDVNSAFLSWTAAYRCLVLGEKTDLREIPSVIAGHQNIRTSIVLAKSIPAKKRGVKTGEPLGMARDKCPDLVVAEPDYDLYVSASQKMIALLREVSPVVEQYSIDEAWADLSGTEGLYGSPVAAAELPRSTAIAPTSHGSTRSRAIWCSIPMIPTSASSAAGTRTAIS